MQIRRRETGSTWRILNRNACADLGTSITLTNTKINILFGSGHIREYYPTSKTCMTNRKLTNVRILMCVQNCRDKWNKVSYYLWRIYKLIHNLWIITLATVNPTKIIFRIDINYRLYIYTQFFKTNFLKKIFLQKINMN